MWHDGPPVLVAAVCGRPLAVSARRAGIPVVVLDIFNDRDMAACAHGSRRVAFRDGGFDPEELLAAADALSPADAGGALVYGSGFERRPELISRLGRGRQLCGNDPATVADIKDPRRFFSALDALGIEHPEVSLDAPLDARGWVAKDCGASGGLHVVSASGARAAAGRYFQRFVKGRAMSALFLADGRNARVVGFSETHATAASARHPFRYFGAVACRGVAARLREVLERAVAALVHAFRLRGLNGIDFIAHEHGCSVLEVNPRPTATVDLYDESVEHGLFLAHLRACRGELPAAIAEPDHARAHAVVYAERALRVPEDYQWPAWCTDLPAGGQAVAEEGPVCTVHAQAPETVGAWGSVLRRSAEIGMLLRGWSVAGGAAHG